MKRPWKHNQVQLQQHLHIGDDATLTASRTSAGDEPPEPGQQEDTKTEQSRKGATALQSLGLAGPWILPLKAAK
jgi:hypothetical protein